MGSGAPSAAPLAPPPHDADAAGADVAPASTPREIGQGTVAAAPHAAQQEPRRLVQEAPHSAAVPPPAYQAGVPGEAALEGVQAPALTLQKIAPAEIHVGRVARFQVKVRNAGRVTAHNVSVHDVTPKGTRLVGTVPRAEVNGNAIRWSLGDLKPGEESIVTMELEPQVEGEIGSVATVGFQAAASARTIATRPLLSISQAAPAKVLKGQPLTISITISNPGTGAAENVVLLDDVPEGLSHPAGKQLEYEVGTLKPGETRKLDLALTAAKAGLVEHVLVARSGEKLSVRHKAQLEVIAPKMRVGIEGPDRRYLDRPATFNVTVSNPGTAPAQDIDLVAYLPKGLKFKSTNNAGQYDAQKHAVYWSLVELPPGQTGGVKLGVMPIEAGSQKIRIEGRGAMDLVDTHEKSVSVEGVASIFYEVADSADPIEVGNSTVYQVRVVNQGSKTATNVRVAAQAPAGLQPVSASGATQAAVSGQQVRFDTLARLAPKAEAIFKIEVRGAQPGDQRVTFQVISDDMTAPLIKQASTRVYED